MNVAPAVLAAFVPAMRSAYPSEWLATVDKALAMHAKLYIPGPIAIRKVYEELARK